MNTSCWIVVVGALLLEAACFLPLSNAFLPPHHSTSLLPASHHHSKTLLPPQIRMSRQEETEQQAREALQSLGDFHQASWKGKATSFSVSADIAAGIVHKKTSPDYQVEVKLSLAQNGEWGFTELYSWQKHVASEGSDAASYYASSRSVSSMAHASMDCDAVDSSYSLHVRPTITATQNDQDETTATITANCELPVDLIGTEKIIDFCVEHCLAVSDDERVRLWALYGGDSQALIRVVVCEETRVPEDPSSSSSLEESSSSLSALDLMEIQSDVDRIVDKIAGQVKVQGDGSSKDNSNNNNDDSATRDPPRDDPPSSSSSEDLKRLQDSVAPTKSQSKNDDDDDDKNKGPPPLTRYPMSLLDLTSGVWLGDSIIRDFSTIQGSSSTDSQSAGKGFGSSSTAGSSSNEEATTPAFGSWEVGVQKVAREWLWDFGEQIRQNNEAGRSLGAEMEPALGQSMGGSVCENQYASRRIPKEDRMVYIDWNDGNGDNHVGFILGSISIQVPRFSTFGERQTKPFYTELCVYQRAPSQNEDGASSNAINSGGGGGGGGGLTIDEESMENIELPEVVCSRICRLYNTQGQMKQGCTSFYTLQRFGTEKDL